MAAALARRASDRDKRVLAVDAVASGGLADALGRAEPRPGVVSGPTQRDVAKGRTGPSLLALSTEVSIDEYIRLNFHVPIAPSSLGPVARIFDFVATAAPAVREILTIGKIAHEVRRGPWDLVVVDGPASGHVVELLDAPRSLGDLVGFGPLASETSWMAELLADPEVTSVVVAAMAEELPVDETETLVERLRKETGLRIGAIVANRLPPPVGPAGGDEAQALADAGDPLAPLAATAVDRHARSTSQLDRLRAIGVPLVEVDEWNDDPVAAAIAGLDAADDRAAQAAQAGRGDDQASGGGER